MKTKQLLLWGAISVLLAQMACQNPVETQPPSTVGKTTKVIGTVRRSDNLTPVPNAIVQDVLGVPSDTTKSDGTFSLSYTVSGRLATTIIARYTGFKNDTARISLAEGIDTTGINLVLKADSSSPVTGPSSGRPASIALVGSDITNISIRGSGANETAALTFEVRDSLGIPVVGAARATVKFSLLGGPGGGEYVFPSSDKTDPSTGRIVAHVHSGTMPGVVQVNATTRNDSVKSSPVRITISGGLPDSAHVSISREKANIAGGVFDNLTCRVSVLLGDRYGNPVPQGTAVSFRTTGGIIQPSATTDANGLASVSLITGNPRPVGGLAMITAQTIGDTSVRKADSSIVRTIRVLFSGATQLVGPTGGFTVPDSGSLPIRFKVSDQAGNPIVGGSTFLVTASGPALGSIQLTGDVNRTIPDVQDTAATNFTVNVVKAAKGGTGGLLTLSVQVTSENGNIDPSNKTSQFVGIVLTSGTGGGGVGGPGVAKSVEPDNESPIQLSLVGTGKNISSPIFFTVRDSLGNALITNPLFSTKETYVTFAISATPPQGLGGAFLTKTVDSTDANGKVNTSFVAGTVSGNYQISASTVVAGKTITNSMPVHITVSGGLADANHVTVWTDKANYPGLLPQASSLGTIFVQANDAFGNPAHISPVYFSGTGGGTIATAYTNAGGQAQSGIIGGLPAPVGGLDTINIYVGSVIKQTSVLFTGAPKIVAPASGFQIPDSGSYTFNFKVVDINNNPLASGNSIAVALSGSGSGEETISGDISRTTTDTKDTSLTNYTVTIRDGKMGGLSGPVVVTINVSGPNGTATYSFTGTLLTTGPTAGGVSGYASSIAFVPTATFKNAVSVRGTGSTETSVFSWQVKDSLGNPVSQSRQVMVHFAIQGGPSTSPSTRPFLSPDSATTDASGNVSTTFNAGTVSGVAQVVASATVNGRVITSSPVPITIYGGLPDSNKITIWTDKSNYPGLANQGIQVGNVFVQLGDRYNNPVQPGTAVYFTTNGGLITPAGYSDANGRTSAVLSGGNPLPPNGKDTITVSMIVEGGVNVQRKVSVLFSGTPKIIAPASGFQIPDSGSYTFSFKVEDANNNPIAAGNTISVTLSGSASLNEVLSGDISRTTVDTKDTSLTNFSVTIRDTAMGGLSGPVTVTINVGGPNGTATYSFNGTLLTTGTSSGAGSGYAASITLLSATSNGTPINTISVKGTGVNETAVLKFVVRDSTGKPVDLNHQVTVTFSIPNSPGGGESLNPLTATTDGSGQVSTTLNAGTISGPIAVKASATVLGVPIASTPVNLTIAGGLPDQNHFTVWTDKVNYPGLLNQGGALGVVKVQAFDVYGNPVQPSNVYFTSNGGGVDASATTNSSGFAQVNLYGGKAPTNGQDTITVSTNGVNGVSVSKKVTVLFTGAPKIIAPASGFQISDSGSYTFSYKVVDVNNNNPLSAGNVISVSLSGPASTEETISGDISRTTIDTKDTSLTNYSVTIRDTKMGGLTGTVTVTIDVAGPNGTATYSFNGTLLTTGVVVGAGTGYASSIALVSMTNNGNAINTISVKGTGVNETALLKFVVKDSSGRSVDQNHAVSVSFSIPNGPGGGETLNPTSGTTDASGLVSTTLNAGTISGPVAVKATATVGGTTISSSPVSLTIAGGLPDQNHFTVWTDKVNYPGLLNQGGALGVVKVQAGDLYGNPVQPSALYFKTNGGNVDATATTSSAGFAQANIYGGNPAPPSGLDTITVSTNGVNGASVTKKVPVTFSGAPVISVPAFDPKDTLTAVPANGILDVNYSIADLNGNPIATGNSISVTASGNVASQLSLGRDISYTTQDVRTGATSLTFRITNNTSSTQQGGTFAITITVSGPNVVGAPVTKKLYGSLLAPSAIVPPSPTAHLPAQIAFISASTNDIFVAGTGSTENSVIVYEVRDSLGIPIGATARAFANYSLQFYPNTFAGGGTVPRIIPSSDSTNDQGRLSISIASGTQAGVVQLVAQINLSGGGVVKSQPVKVTVHAGFADQNHFTLAANKINFGGLQKAFVTDLITVQVADRYSNPVQQGTAVYFNTANGTIQTGGTGGLTDANGFVNVTLYSADPFPVPPDTLKFPLTAVDPTLASSNKKGWSQVYARTLGDSSKQIIDSMLVLWTGVPIIDTTGSSQQHTFATLPSGVGAGPWVFSVKDLYGHPMAPGTTISVTASPAQVNGDANVSLGDNWLAGGGVTDFTVAITNPTTNGTKASAVVVTITVSHPVYGTFTKVLATGSILVP